MFENHRFLYIADLARYLNKTESAIRSCIQRKRLGHQISLPEPIRVGNRLCWKKETVDKFIEEQEAIAEAAAPKKRGRPRKLPPEHPF